MLTNKSVHWCTIIPCSDNTSVTNVSTSELPEVYYLHNEINESDSLNCQNPHFCVRVLHDTINNSKYVSEVYNFVVSNKSSSVRYVDIAIIIPTFLYFVFLTWCLLRQWKVIGKRPLCAVLFTFVYMITICGLVCKATAMSRSYKALGYKVRPYYSGYVHFTVELFTTRCVHCCSVALFWYLK